MRSVPAAIAAAAALVLLAPAQADIYWCAQGNVSKMVQKPLPDHTCRLVDKDPVSRDKKGNSNRAKSASAASASKDEKGFPRVSEDEQLGRDLTRKEILEHELLEEQRNLELARRVLNGPRARSDAGVEREFSYRYNSHELNIIAIQQELERLN